MDTSNLPKDAAFRIELPTFEGPLDLLLHLIKKHELDIVDLPIAFVTERYLHYLQMMQELDLDVASEYLLMAATLAHIKSKSLLPPDPREVEEEDESDEYMEDPRQELIRRLLEYQKYKQAAGNLSDRAQPGRDVFLRGTPAPKAQGEAPLAEVSLFKLLDAFEGILKRVRGKVAFEITAERISIQERMTQISELLRVRKTCTFEELFESDRTRYDVVVTFLALLEMTKLRLTKLYQADVDSPIHVKYALLDADSPDIPLDTTSDVVDKPSWEESAAEESAAPDTFADEDDDDDFDDATLEELLRDDDDGEIDEGEEHDTAEADDVSATGAEASPVMSAEPTEVSAMTGDAASAAAADDEQRDGYRQDDPEAADAQQPATWGAGQVAWPGYEPTEPGTSGDAIDAPSDPSADRSERTAPAESSDDGDEESAQPLPDSRGPSDERHDA